PYETRGGVVVNAMEELRAARPAHLAGGPVDPRTREAELARAFAQPRQARRRVRPLARNLGMAGAALAVAATAVAGLVTREAGPGSPPPTQAASEPVTLSARDVLLVAAGSAERQAADGRYWHVRSRSRTL